MFQPTYHPNPNSDKIRPHAADVFRYHTVIIHSGRTRKLHRKHSKIRLNKHYFIIVIQCLITHATLRSGQYMLWLGICVCVTSWCSIDTSKRNYLLL